MMQEKHHWFVFIRTHKQSLLCFDEKWTVYKHEVTVDVFIHVWPCSVSTRVSLISLTQALSITKVQTKLYSLVLWPAGRRSQEEEKEEETERRRRIRVTTNRQVNRKLSDSAHCHTCRTPGCKAFWKFNDGLHERRKKEDVFFFLFFFYKYFYFRCK